MQKIVPFLWFEDGKARRQPIFIPPSLKILRYRIPCDIKKPALTRKDRLCPCLSSSKDRNFMH